MEFAWTGRLARQTLLLSVCTALAGCGALSGAPDGLRSVGAGMAAHSVCSGAYVAGRPWREVLADDVLPASPLLRMIEVRADDAARSVTATAPGVAPRTARLLPGRGCVLDVPAPPTPAFVLPPQRDAAWPQGDRTVARADWGAGVDADALARVLDAAFVGAGDPEAANTRAVAIVHRGRLLVDRGAPGFPPGTPLHGWSMSKTVVAMLAHQLAAEDRLELAAPVVDMVDGPRTPDWVQTWRTDGRAKITVTDLLYMRDGLEHVEDYGAGASVTRMLFGHADVAAFAAAAPAAAPPGERWRYLSTSTNLLSRTLRSRYASDADYWAAPRRKVFEPIGAQSARIETDTDGTWIGSAYLWASAADWARLGELTLRDGRWPDRQVLAPGWLARVSQPATTTGRGRGYGAQAWRIGDADAGLCRGRGLPEDTIALMGHWGQVVAVVPSSEAVVVRLGWTFDRTKFDPCAFVAQVLETLR